MRRQLLALDPATYRPHALHDRARVWPETNCAADLWIEALHVLGADPVLALGFTLGTDFDGDQWRMFKFPSDDLRRLFGLELDELNVWRPLADHVDEQLSLGHMVTMDVDAWHLPDTAGLTYRSVHQKTTIMVQMIDRAERRLGYFHNTSYYELGGDDFAGVLDDSGSAPSRALPPYVESVRLDDLRPPGRSTVAVAVELGRRHLARRPATNPITRLAKRVEEDVAWLQGESLDTFHRYAFGTLRQCGANAELAAAFVDWLVPALGHSLEPAADRLRRLATGMKSIEFLLARAVMGRESDLTEPFAVMGDAWSEAMEVLGERYGR